MGDSTDSGKRQSEHVMFCAGSALGKPTNLIVSYVLTEPFAGSRGALLGLGSHLPCIKLEISKDVHYHILIGLARFIVCYSNINLVKVSAANIKQFIL